MGKRFSENLESYGIGKVVDRMDELQTEIIAAVRESGLVGNLKLEIKYKRVGVNGIAVIPKITPKIPERPIQAVEMFVDDSNHLHEENPDQLDMENVHVLKDRKTINEV